MITSGIMKAHVDRQLQALRRCVASHIFPYRTLLLAFSGGLDSMVLLDVLTALRDDEVLNGIDGLALRAVHVHHGFSSHADHWVVNCAHECKLRAISFSTVRVVLDVKSNGIEAAARAARYQALANTLKDNEILLTAHHQTDQAETFLMALKRGSGPAGLAGMRPDSPFYGHRLVRPFIECRRTDLEAFAYTRGLRWIEDDSNADLRFDRNFLRLKILPPLRQRWPQFFSTVARSAQLCGEQEKLLDEVFKETLNELTQSDGSLHLRALIEMSEIRRAALLRRWLASFGVCMPSRKKLKHLWKEVALSRPDSRATMQLGERQVRRFRDCLYVLPHFPVFSDNLVILPWKPESEQLILPKGLGILFRHQKKIDHAEQTKAPIVSLKYDTGLGGRRYGLSEIVGSNLYVCSDSSLGANVKTVLNEKHTVMSVGTISIGASRVLVHQAVVRAPLPAERVSVRFGPVHGLLYIIGRHRGRILKKIWQELNVPPWQRSRIPLLFYDDRLISALGVFVTLEGKPQEFQAQWNLVWWKEKYVIK